MVEQWLGVAGIGLVWGWLVALLVARSPPSRRRSWVCLALAALLQGAVVTWQATPRALIVYGVALAAAQSVHSFWIGGLRRGAESDPEQGVLQ